MRVGGGDDPQPGGVHKQGLRGFGVVFNGADAAAVGDADDHRHVDPPLGAGAHLGQLGRDLAEGREYEAVELDFGQRGVPAQGHAHAGAHDARLAQRRVDHPVGPVLALQSLGDAVDAAEFADVLTDQHGVVIVFKDLVQPGGDRLGQGHGGAHGYLPSFPA